MMCFLVRIELIDEEKGWHDLETSLPSPNLVALAHYY